VGSSDSEGQEEYSPRRHGDTEENKGKAESEFTEVAEATEGSAVAAGSSDSERQKMVTTESPRHGEETKAKAKFELTEVAEATELTALQSL
jgi:hypothetical protein